MTILQNKVLDCLANGMSTKEVMAACECSESSVKFIRANKELRKQHDKMRQKDSQNDVSDSLAKAAKELDRIIADPKELSGTIIAAAKLILDISEKKTRNEPQEDITVNIRYV